MPAKVATIYRNMSRKIRPDRSKRLTLHPKPVQSSCLERLTLKLFMELVRTNTIDCPKMLLNPSDGASVLKLGKSGHNSSPLASRFASIATTARLMLAPWRNHFVLGDTTSTQPVTGRAGGVAFAFLSLLLLVSCVGAAIALRQIASLKSEIATFHRDLLPLRERVGKLERTEKARRESDQQAAPDKSGTVANKPGEDNRIDQGGLSLSREEIELVRSYIKPAPLADIAAPPINVGDAVSGATIPLPSPLTEKIPRLLGARFTTRGSAIIIIKRNSHQADAVLAPN